MHVHMSLVVKRSFALSEIPKIALSKLVYLHRAMFCTDTNLDPN